MIEKTKQVYYCEFCGKHYLRKDFSERHENVCPKNPKNFRACMSCKNVKMVEESLYEDRYDREYERKVNVLYCKKLKNYIHPPKVEIKGNYFDFGDILNLPMPEFCDDIDFSYNYTVIDKVNALKHGIKLDK